MIVRRPSGFIKPCLPSKVARPPSGPLWVHEIKHDGYRLMVRRDGARVRCFTRNGHDWADRFPAIVEAALCIKATSLLIDGEAVIARDDGTPDFHALRSKRRGHEAVLYAFDLIEHDGDDLRDLPLIDRKWRLKKLIGKAKNWRAIQFVEHLTGDGPTVFDHVCRMGLEGIVSSSCQDRPRLAYPYVVAADEMGTAARSLSSKNFRTFALVSSSAAGPIMISVRRYADFRCGLAAGFFAVASLANFLPTIGISISFWPADAFLGFLAGFFSFEKVRGDRRLGIC